jgi:uncharacterized protein (DUF1800 family)
MSSDLNKSLAALNRFGLGARPGDPARVARDPQGFVRAQLTQRDAALLPALPPSDAAYRANRAAERQRDAERARAAVQTVAAKPGPQPPAIEDTLYRAEIAARFARLASAEGGLQERLVQFWSNHFCVSVAKGNHLKVMAGPFEREAIRPFVLGRFADMLRAVETHPAMLLYLDNNQSTGPASRNGLSSHRGLNENLAREILELHTLGVDGGYTQTDVTSFAKIITGWTVIWPDDDALYGGRYTFAPSRHEPGPQTVLARAYTQDDQSQGLAVLDDISRHPATARHIAHKLTAHFIADTPPPALVDRLAETFRKTDGDLAAVTRALVDAPEAWTLPLTKLRTPQEFVTAFYRAMGATPDPGTILNSLSAMGQRLWEPPGPNGWPDTNADWASPKSFDTRLDQAAEWGRRNELMDPNVLLDSILGGMASPETRQAVARAESRRQALALLFMAPEMQRR